MIRLAIDAMGSDNGSKAICGAIKNFLKDYQDVAFVVCGKEDELESLKEYGDRVEFVYTDEVMGMEDGALEIMRRKNTSMMKAIEQVALKNCEGVVSAGSTGAFLTGATIKLKLIPGVERAALVSPFPTEDGKGVTLLDIGANNENRPEHLLTFAKMGQVFTEKVRGINEPKVFLLSNGAEEKKGSPVVKLAHQLLKEDKFVNFNGNIEARYVLTGVADVVVCEGYPGNVFLKGTEGTASMMNNLIKKAFKKNIFTMIGYLFAKSGFKEMKSTMDYKKYGGAILLGVNGIAVKGHGSSDEYSFYHAIRVAYEAINKECIKHMKEAMANE